MKNDRPTGEIGGANLPDRGKRTGVNETYGGNIEQGYQKEGSMTGSTGSDSMDQCKARKPENA